MARALEREVIFWRRLDVPGLERLLLDRSRQPITATSCVICLEDGGFQIMHRWKLTPAWRTLSLEVEKHGPKGEERILLERADSGWRLNGILRRDLEGAEEPDLSVTPFCNSLPIRRLMQAGQPSLTLDVCYLDAAKMTVVPSRQRYDLLRPDRVRYLDLGRLPGFEAELDIDERGIVESYGSLFERLFPD